MKTLLSLSFCVAHTSSTSSHQNYFGEKFLVFQAGGPAAGGTGDAPKDEVKADKKADKPAVDPRIQGYLAKQREFKSSLQEIAKGNFPKMSDPDKEIKEDQKKVWINRAEKFLATLDKDAAELQSTEKDKLDAVVQQKKAELEQLRGQFISARPVDKRPENPTLNYAVNYRSFNVELNAKANKTAGNETETIIKTRAKNMLEDARYTNLLTPDQAVTADAARLQADADTLKKLKLEFATGKVPGDKAADKPQEKKPEKKPKKEDKTPKEKEEKSAKNDDNKGNDKEPPPKDKPKGQKSPKDDGKPADAIDAPTPAENTNDKPVILPGSRDVPKGFKVAPGHKFFLHPDIANYKRIFNPDPDQLPDPRPNVKPGEKTHYEKVIAEVDRLFQQLDVGQQQNFIVDNITYICAIESRANQERIFADHVGRIYAPIVRPIVDKPAKKDDTKEPAPKSAVDAPPQKNPPPEKKDEQKPDEKELEPTEADVLAETKGSTVQIKLASTSRSDALKSLSLAFFPLNEPENKATRKVFEGILNKRITQADWNEAQTIQGPKTLACNNNKVQLGTETQHIISIHLEDGRVIKSKVLDKNPVPSPDPKPEVEATPPAPKPEVKAPVPAPKPDVGNKTPPGDAPPPAPPVVPAPAPKVAPPAAPKDDEKKEKKPETPPKDSPAATDGTAYTPLKYDGDEKPKEIPPPGIQEATPLPILGRTSVEGGGAVYRYNIPGYEPLKIDIGSKKPLDLEIQKALNAAKGRLTKAGYMTEVVIGNVAYKFVCETPFIKTDSDGTLNYGRLGVSVYRPVEAVKQLPANPPAAPIIAPPPAPAPKPGDKPAATNPKAAPQPAPAEKTSTLTQATDGFNPDEFARKEGVKPFRAVVPGYRRFAFGTDVITDQISKVLSAEKAKLKGTPKTAEANLGKIIKIPGSSDYVMVIEAVNTDGAMTAHPTVKDKRLPILNGYSVTLFCPEKR